MVDGGSILRDLHIPWPAANEGDLHTAAATWKSLANTIRDDYGKANSTAQGLVSNNEGKAITAFENYWAKYAGAKGALPVAAQACDAMAGACTKYANAVAETKTKIEQAGAEVAATLIVGTIGAFFTFGATEGIADSVAAGDAVADVLASGAAASVGSSILSGAAAGVGGNAAALAEENSLRQLFG